MKRATIFLAALAFTGSVFAASPFDFVWANSPGRPGGVLGVVVNNTPGPGFIPGHVPPTVPGPTLPGPAPFNTPPPFQGGATPPATPTAQPASAAQQQPAARARRGARIAGSAMFLLVETYFYFAICTKEKEVNPTGWFAQNCYAPNWGVVDAPLPGEYVQ